MTDLLQSKCFSVDWILRSQSFDQRVDVYEHFEIQQITSKVYAAIAINGKQAICNSGIVDLGENILIFDTFNSPTPAQELKRAASTLLNKPIKYVVNSHYHGDHTRGNQVFVDTNIIASKFVCDDFIQREEKTIRSQKNTIPNRLKQVETELNELKTRDNSTSDTDFKQENLRVWRGYLTGVNESLPILKPTPPNQFFRGDMKLVGTHASVKLVEVGPTHTESDVYLWMEEERILFTGDLVSYGYHPMASETNFDNLLETLYRLIELRPKYVVPGHGQVTDTNGIAKLIKYFDLLMEQARSLKDEISSLINDSTIASIPDEFRRWIFGPEFYPMNLQAALKYLKMT